MNRDVDVWIDKNVKKYGIPKGCSASSLYHKDPEVRRTAAWDMYDLLNREESKEVELIPYQKPDGSIKLLDRCKGHIVAFIRPKPNGLFEYEGSTDYITMLGGRGELSTIADRMADGKYFNKQ